MTAERDLPEAVRAAIAAARLALAKPRQSKDRKDER